MRHDVLWVAHEQEKKKKRPKSAIGKLQIMVKKFFYAGVALSLAIFWYM